MYRGFESAVALHQITHSSKLEMLGWEVKCSSSTAGSCHTGPVKKDTKSLQSVTDGLKVMCHTQNISFHYCLFYRWTFYRLKVILKSSHLMSPRQWETNVWKGADEYSHNDSTWVFYRFMKVHLKKYVSCFQALFSKLFESTLSHWEISFSAF